MSESLHYPKNTERKTQVKAPNIRKTPEAKIKEAEKLLSSELPKIWKEFSFTRNSDETFSINYEHDRLDINIKDPVWLLEVAEKISFLKEEYSWKWYKFTIKEKSIPNKKIVSAEELEPEIIATKEWLLRDDKHLIINRAGFAALRHYRYKDFNWPDTRQVDLLNNRSLKVFCDFLNTKFASNKWTK